VFPGHRKKRLGRSRLSVVLCRRMGLRIYNLPSGRLKKRFWKSRWIVVSWFQKAMNFLNHRFPKKATWTMLLKWRIN
jgi:hypothetical protein